MPENKGEYVIKQFSLAPALVVSLLIFSSLFALSCGGSSPGLDDPSATSSESAPSETVGSADMETSDTDKCATVSVIENIGDSSGGDFLSLKEAFATILDDNLTRARVVTSNDATVATTFETWRQLLGYTCDSAETCNNLALEYASSFVSADILVTPTVYVVGQTYYLFASAWNLQSNKSIGRWNTEASADAAIAALAEIGSLASEGIKDQVHCLKVTPRAAVIDYDNASKRTQIFTAQVKNLKNEKADVGTVAFSLKSPEWGTLSPSSVAVANGEASVTFTMTRRRTNTLTATYSSDTETNKEARSSIIPLEGLVISVNGTRKFRVDAEPFELFLPGSTWTYLGNSTVTGYIPIVDDEDSPGSIFGNGWYQETQTAKTAAHIIAPNADETAVITCDISGSETGTSNGEWIVFGSKTDTTATIEGMGLGQSGGGMTATGSCPGMGAGGSGAFATFASFSSVQIKLEAGTTATGSDSVSDYDYTLRVLRATN